jgi:ribosomal protein L13E
MKGMKGLNETAALLAVGPIDLVGHAARPTLARGYSPLELERAGVTIEKAREFGIPIDAARTSGVGANVMRLRLQLASR